MIERKPRAPWVRVSAFPSMNLATAETLNFINVGCARCAARLEQVADFNGETPEAEALALKLWNFAQRHRRCECPRCGFLHCSCLGGQA
jgi:hypothetical protein